MIYQKNDLCRSRKSRLSTGWRFLSKGKKTNRLSGNGYRSLAPNHIPQETFSRSFVSSLSHRFLEKNAIYLLRVVLTASLLLGVWVNHSPGFIAADDGLTPLASILQQADNAAAEELWERAGNCYKKAFEQSDEPQREYIHERIQWCYAHNSLEQRYSDGSIVRHLRSVGPDQAQNILNQTLELIEQNYYQNFDRKERLWQSLLQLQLVTEKPFIHQQFSVNNSVLQELKHRLKSLCDELKNCTNFDFNTWIARILSLRNLSEKAGLGASWPALELAYAFTDSLDRYSYMLSPDCYRRLRDHLNGFYSGIGVDLVFEEQYPLVFDVVPNSPAQIAGVVSGDRLIDINGKNCKGKNNQQIRNLLLGQTKSEVKLIVERRDHQYRLTMAQKLIQASSIRHEQLLDKGIGYLRVANFDQDTAWEMRRAIDRLVLRGAVYLLIDLRCNGGGVMSSAIDAVRLFIDQGSIVTVKTVREKSKYTAGGEYFSCYKMPLALLVDQKTASAAEIFSAALQYHQRAIVIGEKTMGKNIVQTVYNLNPGSVAICITTAWYIPPHKNKLHQQAIIPDISVKNNYYTPENSYSMRHFLSSDNPALQQAIKHFN